MFAKAAVSLLALLLAAPVSAITPQEAKAEADAWVASRIEDWVVEFKACAEINLRNCHPVWSASVLPDTNSADSTLAVVTNDDPGPFRGTPCGDCYDDSVGTWTIADVDIPRSTPVQMRANTFGNGPLAGINVVGRFSLDGVIYEKAWSVSRTLDENGEPVDTGPTYDWREVEVNP